MRKIQPIFAFVVLLLASSIIFAQNNTKSDSLRAILNSNQKDTKKIKLLLSSIEDFRAKGQLTENMAYVDELLTICDKNLAIIKDSSSKYPFLKAKAKAFNAYGTFNANKINPNEGINSHLKAIEIQKTIGAVDDLIESYSRIANIYWRRLRDYDKAIEMYFFALDWATKINSKKNIMEANKWIGAMYSMKSDSQQSFKYFNLWLKSAEEINDKKSIADAHTDLGIYYKTLGDFQQAFNHFNITLSIYSELASIEKTTSAYNSIADCYHNLASLYLDNANFSEGLIQLLNALKLREQSNNKKGAAIENLSIARIYINQKNYPEAISRLLQSLKTLEQFRDGFTVECYMIISTCYKNQQNFSDAIIYVEKAVKLSEELKDKSNAAGAYSLLAAIYKQQSNFTEALKSAFKSLELTRETNNKFTFATTKLTIGTIYMEFPDSLSKAKQNIEEAVIIFKKIGHKGNLKACYYNLAEISYRQQSFKEGYENFKKYLEYHDSTLNTQQTENLVKLRMQYEFDKKQDSLKYQQTLINEKLNQQRLLSKQQKQSLLLKENQLALATKEKEIQRLAYLQTQSELQLEQNKRSNSEKELLFTSQEKNLQAAQLKLQQKDIQQKSTQRNIFIAGTVALLLLTFFIFRNFQNQRKANKFMQAASEKQMVELQLENLRAQLNPHFMFNSLNAIQELIVTDKTELSQSYLERFAKLLRMLLENANQPFIPLRKEVNFLDLYLSLENLRIPELKYSITVDPDVNAEKATTPNMMLQPYIENALWHGLQHKQGEKKLQLHISRQNGSIEYEIRDNGVGRKKAEELKGLYRKEHKSKGMELLSKRFSLLSKEYGKDIQTEVTDLTENDKSAGTVVKIIVPFALSEANQKI